VNEATRAVLHDRIVWLTGKAYEARAEAAQLQCRADNARAADEAMTAEAAQLQADLDRDPALT
jgi:hypothetical protein